MRKPQFSLGFLTICISRDLKFNRFGGVACADIKFITFRVKLKISDSSKSITFLYEKQRFLHFGDYRGVKMTSAILADVKKDVGQNRRRYFYLENV